jgi:predicted nucleotidyltransferase
MYNAIRKPQEIRAKYGLFKYVPIKPVKFHCTVIDDSEAMFRPATYRIRNYESVDPASVLPNETVPKLVASMIGCYRNVARNGDKIRVSGMLEHVENLENREVFHQVVVGTGTSEDEHVWPL